MKSRALPLAFSFADISFGFGIVPHLLRTSVVDLSPRGIGKLLGAPSKERNVAVMQAIALDPYVLRKVALSTDDDYTEIGAKTIIPRDFDLWMRCATELGHRGDYIPILFDKWFSGSALNAQPERYGQCPFGKWETYKDQEPHLMGKDRYPAQVEQIERLIDDYMSKKVGKKEHLGSMLRQLIWDLYSATCYGVEPGPDTVRTLELFENHSDEFDYVMRMDAAEVPYEWSDKLTQEIKGMGDWCWEVAQDRQKNIAQYADKVDLLTDLVLNHKDIDFRKSEGALRGAFTGGINNTHSVVCGVLIANATSKDSVHNYLDVDSGNIENIFREGLRLYTSIPTSRSVRPEDNFVLDGKKLESGTTVVLSTYAINTDPRSWDDALTYDPARFEGTEELGFLCQKGFAPLGAAAELGGRPCGARYYNAHMLRTILRKLLTDYKFTKVGGRDFEFRQSAGTSMYASNCEMLVEKR